MRHADCEGQLERRLDKGSSVYLVASREPHVVLNPIRFANREPTLAPQDWFDLASGKCAGV
jgi:hypothetical protein